VCTAQTAAEGHDIMRIYLAGPLGFSEAGRHFHNGVLVPRLVGLGHTVLDPWELTDKNRIQQVARLPYGTAKCHAWRKINTEIGTNNRNAIDACDAVLAILDGVDVDSGTAAEIGYAFARGKPILGYRGDFRLSADNEGGMVNIQVEYFIRESGGDIVQSLAELPMAIESIAANRKSD
jgi:nucleoside 2-deoxyribosyltransferase